MKKSFCFLLSLCLCLTLLAACSNGNGSDGRSKVTTASTLSSSIGANVVSSLSPSIGANIASALSQSPQSPAGWHLVYQQTGSYTAQLSQTFQLNGESVLAFSCQNGGDFGVLAYDASQYDTQISPVMTSQCNPQDGNQEEFTFNGPAYVSITADSYNTPIEWEVVVYTQD